MLFLKACFIGNFLLVFVPFMFELPGTYILVGRCCQILNGIKFELLGQSELNDLWFCAEEIWVCLEGCVVRM